MLDCCDDSNDPDFDEAGGDGTGVTSVPLESEGTCSTYQNCERENLTGACCPSLDGVYLDCCINHNLPSEAQCVNNEKCAAIPLAGFCCPTAGKSDVFGCCSCPLCLVKLLIFRIFCSRRILGLLRGGDGSRF